MENSTTNKSQSSAGDMLTLNEFFYMFGFPTIGFISFLLNAFSFMIFCDSEFRREKLFTYLRLQSLCISVDLLAVAILSPIFINRTWPTLSTTYLARLLYQYDYCYMENVLEKTELAYTILAGYCCRQMIKGQSTPGNPHLIAALVLPR
jgi:hypothetical protein